MKYRLLAPGPTPVPDRVLSAMSCAIYHHRTPQFEAVFSECSKGLRWLLGTELDVLTLSSSGTGAFEAALQNFFSPGDTVINVGGGKFSERWGKMSKALGLNVVEVPAEWGQAADVNAVKKALQANPNAKGVLCVASETSTGVRHPYEAIGALVKEMSDCLYVVDGITAVGVWDMQPERDGIDVLVFASQKALMLPPGLGFVSVSDKAWTRMETATAPRFYFDLKRERKAQKENQTAFTPAVSLMVGLKEALAMMKEEGKAEIFARHTRLAAATRAGCAALGLKLLTPSPAESVTAVFNPPGVRPDAVYKGLRDRANLTIAGGQDALKGKIFRVAHLGYFDELDICTVLGAIELVLHEEGYRDFKPGASLAAAMPLLAPAFGAKAR